MTISYSVHADPAYVVTAFSGTLTLGELTHHVGEMIHLAEDDKVWIELTDCRGVTDVTGLTGSGIRSIAAMEKGRHWVDGSKSAIVVNSALHYGLARIFAAVAARVDKNIKVFYSADEAIDWLGLSDWKQQVMAQLGELVQQP